MIGPFTWGTPRYTTLVDNGPPDKRLDVAILGDGYAAADMPLFEQDAATIVQAFHDIEPMRSYIRHFNFHRVDLVARQSGISDRYQKPPVRRASPLGTFFSPLSERRLVGPDPWVYWVANRSGVPWDSVLVVVNTPRRGGATLFTMGIGYASRNSSDFPRIMIHEAGHAIAKLMDEYVDPLVPDVKWLQGRSLPNFVLPFANVTTNGRRPKWADWVLPDVPCPTDPTADSCSAETIGAIEGASYVSFGAYRPTINCMMRQHSAPFCPVCQEQWIKRIYRRSPIADGFRPAQSPGDNPLIARAGEPVTLAADVLRPPHVRATWRVREGGRWGWDVYRIDYGYRDLTLAFDRPNTWAVELILEDRGPKVRKADVIRRSRQTFRWRLNVV